MSPRRLVPALLASGVLAASGAAAEPMGRLFFSPAQRSALERQRDATPMASDGGGPLRFDGLVTRSGGGATVWVNGRPRHDGPADAPGLRVGEVLDVQTREKRDLIAPGAIRIGHGQAATRP